MLVVTMPAYNEAAGILAFLHRIDGAFGDDELKIVVVDDCSTDDTLTILQASADAFSAELVVAQNEHNRGHGPTAHHAYRRALAEGADVVLHVDGDGQFSAADMVRVAAGVGASPVVHGTRSNRVDPWFRKALTGLVRVWVRLMYGVGTTDANTPLRAFDANTLRSFLAVVPENALVPNIYLTVLATKADHGVAKVSVAHLDREDGQQGTMWGNQRGPILIPKRLLKFVAQAGRESIAMRRKLKTA